MAERRTIKKITRGIPSVDGAGVHLVRVFGYHDVKDYDPFLMLDAFDSQDPEDYIKGFPWHPHRGIETVTYLIEGDIEHSDSLQNAGSIKDGDAQWMTAGSGIIHQEMPQPAKRMLGAQLWINLPQKDKMTAPAYGDIKKEDVPVVEENGNKVHVISGNFQGTKGAFEGKYVKATYLDVEVRPECEWTFTTEREETMFIYILRGELSFEPEGKTWINEKNAVLLNKGEEVYVKTRDKNARFLLLSAMPLKEPIAWGGPIVMNTKEELDRAFRELDENTFLK